MSAIFGSFYSKSVFLNNNGCAITSSRRAWNLSMSIENHFPGAPFGERTAVKGFNY